jgi:AAA domain
MRIPERQEQLDKLTRKYLTEPQDEEDGRRHSAATNALTDEEVIALCRKAKNAAKFADLFDAGHTAAYDGDDSSADLALVSIIAFYTQDEDQIDRIFSRSALYRPDKWGKRSDYRRRTIAKALDRLTEMYTPPRERSNSANSANPTNPTNSANSANRMEPITAAELMGMTFDPTRWVVPDVLPEGLTLLVGKPKKGKSWMGLGTCEAVAAGGVAFGTKRVEQGDTLYLALEDNRKRLRKRLAKILDGRPAPERMHLHTEWPRLDEGGAERLDEWLTEHPEARLVVVDTLAKIRKPARGQNVYTEDYAALEQLLPLASKHSVAIVVVHHLRKMAASDPLDEISSSTGLTAGVDGFLILRRTPGSKGPTLYVDGRDIEEPTEYALLWNINTATWTIEGNAEEVHLSKERGDILLTLNRSSEPMTPKQVADVMPGAKHNNVKYLMWAMLGDGQLLKDDKGRYSPANPTNRPTNPKKAHSSAGNDDQVSGVSEDSGVGECRHGTPEGYPCDDCEIDDLFGGAQ